MDLKRLLISGILAFTATGCSSLSATSHVQYTTIELPKDMAEISILYWSLIWHPDLGLTGIVSTEEDPREYFLVPIDSLAKLPLRFESPYNCKAERYSGFALLPNEQLGVELTCYGNFPEENTFLLTYNFETQELKQLVNSPMPDLLTPRGYAWHPDMSIGVHAMNDGLSGTIFWISPDGLEPIENDLVQGGRTWNMAEPFRKVDDIRGLAHSPAWSPDDNLFVFFGSVFRDGLTGISKIGAQASLYLFSLNTMEIKELRSGFVTPGSTTWSPDGEWIAFSSQMGRFSGEPNQRKLWLYSLQTDTLVEIAQGRNGNLVWDPTGRQLGSILCLPTDDDEYCGAIEIRVYDVSEIVGDR